MHASSDAYYEDGDVTNSRLSTNVCYFGFFLWTVVVGSCLGKK